MLPWGSEPFGSGYFGRGNWGRRVFWQNVPADHQIRDTNGDLEGLLTTWAAEYDDMRQDVMRISEQRDPWLARATDGGEWIYATQCLAETDENYGDVIKLIEPANPSNLPTATSGADWLPYTVIDEVGVNWTVLAGDAEWPVVNVRTRNADDASHYDASESIGNEVWCSTGTILPFIHTSEIVGAGDGTADPDIALPIDGWLVASSISITLTGSVSGSISISDDGAGNLLSGVTNVGSVVYETGALTLDITALGEVVVDATDILADYEVTGYYLRMRPMPMLEQLYGDFGILADRDVPEWVQRAALIHYRWYMGQKGSTPAYEILGDIYLFDVEAMGLWEVCDFDQISDYPADNVFTMGTPIRYFTDIAPRKLLFDDISADAQYWDDGTATWIPLLDQEVIYGDPAVNWSLAKKFAVDVTQGYYPASGRVPCTVASATPLSSADLALYGLSDGFRIEVNMSADQRAEFNFTGRGIFSISEYDQAGAVPPSFTADAWYVDEDEGYAGGVWTIITAASVAPAVGIDVAVRYWPPVDTTDCCYCRTSYVRFVVLPSADAIAYYGSDDSVGSRLVRARDRLEARIERLLVPQHVRVFEFAHS